MSRTKRIYNQRSFFINHPYRQFCMGHCKLCKDVKREQRIRTEKQMLFRLALASI